MDKSDEELMLEYQQGQEEVIEVLFLRYQKPIFNFAIRFLDNRADAEDVTAEIFLHLIQSKNQFQPKAKFSTWLYTVARNACISRIRKRKPEVTEWEIPDSKTPADEMQRKEIAFHIKKAVRRLPADQKEAFVLREFQNLTYQEISSVTGHSLENVKVLIFRARERLRLDLAGLFKEAQS